MVKFSVYLYRRIFVISPPKTERFHTQIQIYFHISAQIIDCGYSLEPPCQSGPNEYPQSMFLCRNKDNNVYPCKPQFYYIKVGFKGVKIIEVCLSNEKKKSRICFLPSHSIHYAFA